MDEKQIREIIANGTDPYVEFSNCTTELTDSVFQSICSFMNKQGGVIIVGVHDFGKIMGIAENYLNNMFEKFTRVLEHEFSPAVSITPEIVDFGRKKVLYISVPESQEIQRYRNKIYDRIGDEVYDVSYNYNLIENIYLRKQKESSEKIVCPFLRMNELDEGTFRLMRKYISETNPDHHWLNLTDEEILHDAGFWRKDPLSKKEGFVLAAVLLFGKEITIQNYSPATHRTEAIYRNIRYDEFTGPISTYPDSKYDDRDIIFSNLIQSYIRLITFVNRHLPERNLTLDNKTVDIRHKVLNEIITNFLVHREFTHKLPSRLSIFADKIITENGADSSSSGNVLFEDLAIKTRNPLISKIFREIGWMGKSGLGKSNITEYAPYYDKTYEIEIQTGEKFIFSMTYGNDGLDTNEVIQEKANIPQQNSIVIPTVAKEQWTQYYSKLEKICPEIDISYVDKAELILEFCVKAQPIQDMMKKVRQSNRTRFRQNIIRPLIEEGLLAMRIPTKPSSPLQTYFTTEKGRTLLEL